MFAYALTVPWRPAQATSLKHKQRRPVFLESDAIVGPAARHCHALCVKIRAAAFAPHPFCRLPGYSPPGQTAYPLALHLQAPGFSDLYHAVKNGLLDRR